VKYTGDTYGIEYDTDIEGANLPGTVVAQRWLGFVRTNSSGDICHFTMQGDMLMWSKSTDNVLSNSITTTFATVDHSAMIPEARISLIEYGCSDASATGSIYTTDDGTNASFYIGRTASDNTVTNGFYAWSHGDYDKATMKPYLPTRKFKSSTGTLNLLICAVELKR